MGVAFRAVVSKPAAAAPAKPFSEREAQLLAELGFGQKPIPEPAPYEQRRFSRPSASGGNGGSALPRQASQNGKRSLSLGMSQVEALLKSKLVLTLSRRCACSTSRVCPKTPPPSRCWPTSRNSLPYPPSTASPYQGWPASFSGETNMTTQVLKSTAFVTFIKATISSTCKS